MRYRQILESVTSASIGMELFDYGVPHVLADFPIPRPPVRRAPARQAEHLERLQAFVSKHALPKETPFVLTSSDFIYADWNPCNIDEEATDFLETGCRYLDGGCHRASAQIELMFKRLMNRKPVTLIRQNTLHFSQTATAALLDELGLSAIDQLRLHRAVRRVRATRNPISIAVTHPDDRRDALTLRAFGFTSARRFFTFYKRDNIRWAHNQRL